jgi:hypothetical protein
VSEKVLSPERCLLVLIVKHPNTVFSEFAGKLVYIGPVLSCEGHTSYSNTPSEIAAITLQPAVLLGHIALYRNQNGIFRPGPASSLMIAIVRKAEQHSRLRGHTDA